MGLSAIFKFVTGAPSTRKCAEAPESDSPNSTSTILVNVLVSKAVLALGKSCKFFSRAMLAQSVDLDLNFRFCFTILFCSLAATLFLHFRVVLDRFLPPHGSIMDGIVIGILLTSESLSLSSVSGSVALVSSSLHPLRSADKLDAVTVASSESLVDVLLGDSIGIM